MSGIAHLCGKPVILRSPHFSQLFPVALALFDPLFCPFGALGTCFPRLPPHGNPKGQDDANSGEEGTEALACGLRDLKPWRYYRVGLQGWGAPLSGELNEEAHQRRTIERQGDNDGPRHRVCASAAGRRLQCVHTASTFLGVDPDLRRSRSLQIKVAGLIRGVGN